MKTKLLVIAMILTAIIGTVYGFINANESTAEDYDKIYTVQKLLKVGDGMYVPEGSFEIDRDSLETYIVISYWTATWYNGDLYVEFEADQGVTWMVRIQGNDGVIEGIRQLVNRYELKCSIPD